MSDFNYTEYLRDNPLLKIDLDNTLITERKKEGYDDREDESVSARKGKEAGKKQSFKDRRDDSYGKMGKRDAEKKGKNKINKEGVVKEDEQFVGNNINANKLLNIFAEYLPFNHYHQDKTLSYDEALEMATEFVKFVGMDSTGEDFLMHIADTESSIKEDESKPVSETAGKYYEEDDIDAMSENARTDAEQEGYKDGFDDAKDDVKDALSKMKVSELKAKIRETILSELSEESQYNASIYSEAEEDVDVDVDVEDEVNVDVEPDEIDIEKKAVRTTVDVGLSPEEEVIQDSLKAAMDSANALGNDKLADQIGNTITFFTREYVVGNRDDD